MIGATNELAEVILQSAWANSKVKRLKSSCKFLHPFIQPATRTQESSLPTCNPMNSREQSKVPAHVASKISAKNLPNFAK